MGPSLRRSSVRSGVRLGDALAIQISAVAAAQSSEIKTIPSRVTWAWRRDTMLESSWIWHSGRTAENGHFTVEPKGDCLPP